MKNTAMDIFWTHMKDIGHPVRVVANLSTEKNTHIGMVAIAPNTTIGIPTVYLLLNKDQPDLEIPWTFWGFAFPALFSEFPVILEDTNALPFEIRIGIISSQGKSLEIYPPQLLIELLLANGEVEMNRQDFMEQFFGMLFWWQQQTQEGPHPSIELNFSQAQLELALKQVHNLRFMQKFGFNPSPKTPQDLPESLPDGELDITTYSFSQNLSTKHDLYLGIFERIIQTPPSQKAINIQPRHYLLQISNRFSEFEQVTENIGIVFKQIQEYLCTNYGHNSQILELHPDGAILCLSQIHFTYLLIRIDDNQHEILWGWPIVLLLTRPDLVDLRTFSLNPSDLKLSEEDPSIFIKILEEFWGETIPNLEVITRFTMQWKKEYGITFDFSLRGLFPAAFQKLYQLSRLVMEEIILDSNSNAAESNVDEGEEEDDDLAVLTRSEELEDDLNE